MKSYRDYVKRNAASKERNTGEPYRNDSTAADRTPDIRNTAAQNAAAQNTSEQNADVKTAELIAERVANAYRGKGERAVFADILATAEKGKREGTLTNEEIDAFYASFSPVLTPLQRKKLAQIVERLKRI